MQRRALTIFGRSLLLVLGEIVANIVCWVICAVLFRSQGSVLGLALLSWTAGLRHGLDADHISAIDNATRALINRGQTPVTCGLWFSLGHSTIVIAVNVAIAVSTSALSKLHHVSDIGGIVGTSVSGSFLFLVGVANTVVVVKLLRRRRAAARMDVSESDVDGQHHEKLGACMSRLVGPLINFVNRPYKMYVIGVLFGFGFDTASTVGLLSIAAIGKTSQSSASIPPSSIITFPFLFTSGMTLVDSLDSIIMLYSYTDFADKSIKVLRKAQQPHDGDADAERPPSIAPTEKGEELTHVRPAKETPGKAQTEEDSLPVVNITEKVKQRTMSHLSIVLTIMSILLAYSISVIEIMGLIGGSCSECQQAQERGGLARHWWNFWAKASDNLGYIGAGIVGAFVFVVVGWYSYRWWLSKRKASSGPA